MKYSLRSLMAVVTLACVLLGARIEYLHRMAAFHEQEAEKYASLIIKERVVSRSDLDFFERSLRFMEQGDTIYMTCKDGNIEFSCDERFLSFLKHRDLAVIYGNSRPWMFVDQSQKVPLP
jgi:hypothetical protein